MPNEMLPSMGYSGVTITNTTGKTGAAGEAILTAPQAAATVKWIDLGNYEGGLAVLTFIETAGNGATIRVYESVIGTDATQSQIGGDQTLAGSGSVNFRISAVQRFLGVGFLNSGGSNAVVRGRILVTRPTK